MTKEKFKQVAIGNMINVIDGQPLLFTPEGWAVLKPQYISFMKKMDELLEVYNLENGVKDGN